MQLYLKYLGSSIYGWSNGTLEILMTYSKKENDNDDKEI